MVALSAVTLPSASRKRGLAVACEGLRATLLAERDRWVLWSPVLIGLGVGAYFTQRSEPPLWLGPAVALAGLAMAVLWRRSTGGRWTAPSLLCVIVALVALGFSAAGARTAILATPVLDRGLGPTPVEGTVEAVEVFPKGSRIVLGALRFPALDAPPPVERVRVRLRGDQPDIAPGDRIRVPARLNPPPPPAAPGAFDFQRHAYFAGLGAVGYAVGVAAVLSPSPDAEGRARAWVNAARFAIGERIRAASPDTVGAVIVALTTGDRSGIPEPVMAAIRDSGLAHLLAISGLHIGLVAGFLFFVSRAALALIPPLALRFPIKKWAAVVSLLGAGGYMLLAGATVPSQRAFIMVAIVLLAILVDRKGISMRLVAWAAGAILLVRPEVLLGASFQLSFAAVVSLIAVYEVVGDMRRSGDGIAAWPRRAATYVAAIALTTIVATAATAPFSAFHFNQFQMFGVLANVAAVPITALWIMPWAVAAFVLMPVGLEGLALAPMGWGVACVVEIAETVAAWPGATLLVPSTPGWALCAVTAGGLWLCLWRRPWRYAGLFGIALGAASLAIVRTPDLLIDNRGSLMAFHVEGEGYWLSTQRRSRFVRDIWLSGAGEASAAGVWPAAGPVSDGRLICDPLGCVVRDQGYVIAFVRHPAAMEDDCRAADLVISPFAAPDRCGSAMLVIDRFDLWRNGAHAVWLGARGPRVESVNGVRGDRPWVIGAARRRPGKAPKTAFPETATVAARR